MSRSTNTVRHCPEWWRRAVVYQIYPRSFADSDGDGIGDLPGIIGRLDYLADLGVDALWLGPVHRSPQADNGYDVSDYQDVDPIFGTLADLDELVAQAHARGLRIILDLVVNHTSDEHPWFVESSAGTDSSRRAWYLWRPPRAGAVGGTPGAEPNNWGSAFGGPAWTFDPASGEYYLHLFSPKQPDLNWANPEVRAAVHAMMGWWLDRDVDGFRLDVINHIAKDPELPDGPVPAGGRYGDGRGSYLDLPEVHDYLRELRERVLSARPGHHLLIGETPGVGVRDARRYTDPTRGELDLVIEFEHAELDRGRERWVHRPLALPDLKASWSRWQTGLADVGWNSLYLSNHDQARLVSRYGDAARHRRESATALATVLHLHRGTPFVYQGEELGMANFPFGGIEDFRDVEALTLFQTATSAGVDPDEVLAGLRLLGRDNARTPFQWDGSEHGGFTTGSPWMPVNPDVREVNAASQLGVPGSVHDHYRRLIALRHTEPAVVWGDVTILLPDHPSVYALVRRLDDTELLMVANLSSTATALPAVPDQGAWAEAEIVLTNDLGTNHRGPLPVSLRPWEAWVRRRRRPRPSSWTGTST